MCTHTGCSHDANHQSLCFRGGCRWRVMPGTRSCTTGMRGEWRVSLRPWLGIISTLSVTCLVVLGRSINSQSCRLMTKPIRASPLAGHVPWLLTGAISAPGPRSNVPRRASTGQRGTSALYLPPPATCMYVTGKCTHSHLPPYPRRGMRGVASRWTATPSALPPPPSPLLQPPRPSPVTSAHTPGQAPAAVPAGWGPGSPAQLG